MNKSIEPFAKVVEEPYAWLATSKQKDGRRAIGCFPLYVPHEMVEAAGMRPVDIYGGSGELAAAAGYLQTITCYPVRSALELLLSGQLGVLDGTIMASICPGATSGGEVWRGLDAPRYYHQLIVPRAARGQHVVRYYKRQIERLQTSLEDFGGRKITTDDLAKSIKLYNRGRSLLSELSAINRRNPDALPPQDFAMVRAAAAFMPRAEYTELLSGLVAQLQAAAAAPAGERVKLVLVGSICDLPQYAVLAQIHEAGGAVVEDDTPMGRRMWFPVAEDIDPVDALAQHYVDSPPCPTKCDDTLETNVDYLVGLTKSSGAQGIVFLRPLYCDAPGLEYPLLCKRLNAADIPTLWLDVDGREPASGQVQTRLQAFIEMLRR